MKYGKVIIILLLFSSIINTHAQQTIITGKVIDSETGSPLSYASIRLKEKAVGTVANERGEFTLNLTTPPEEYTLVVSFIGYMSYEIKLTEFNGLKNKTIQLNTSVNELAEVVVTEDKFDLQKFMKKVSKNYKSSSRTTPHVAQAYYQEQVNINGKPVMFADGIGYSVYMGNEGNWAPLSNYKYFYEQVSVNKDFQSWTDFIRKTARQNFQTFGGSGNLNNFRFAELNGPLADGGNESKFTLDSTFSMNGQEYLAVSFKKGNNSGWLVVGENNLQIKFLAFDDGWIWSNTFHDRVRGTLAFTIDYFEDQPYLSTATSYYQKGDVTQWSKLKVVSQKFDKLELSREEYGLVNSLSTLKPQEAQESEIVFQPYDFSKKDSELRAVFTTGFKGQIVDVEQNPDYTKLLRKFRAFF